MLLEDPRVVLLWPGFPDREWVRPNRRQRTQTEELFKPVLLVSVTSLFTLLDLVLQSPIFVRFFFGVSTRMSFLPTLCRPE